MILVAESGSTKCDWLLLDEQGEHLETHQTMGFNPYYHSVSFIEQKLEETEELQPLTDIVREIYFFGAGCSNRPMKEIVRKALSSIFEESFVYVSHDLIAAAYSTWQGEPCISCILGTGSNSCYFERGAIRQEVPSLAYILGDEGSGSYFGKELLRHYFYGRLPSHLRDAIDERYALTHEIMMENVYRKPHPNVYLADFMPFIVHHRTDPLIRRWIHDGFSEFIDLHVLCYKESSRVPVHFVGSVAALLEEDLKQVAAIKSIKIGEIIRKPGFRLAEYVWEHREQIAGKK